MFSIASSHREWCVSLQIHGMMHKKQRISDSWTGRRQMNTPRNVPNIQRHARTVVSPFTSNNSFARIVSHRFLNSTWYWTCPYQLAIHGPRRIQTRKPYPLQSGLDAINDALMTHRFTISRALEYMFPALRTQSEKKLWKPSGGRYLSKSLSETQFPLESGIVAQPNFSYCLVLKNRELSAAARLIPKLSNSHTSLCLVFCSLLFFKSYGICFLSFACWQETQAYEKLPCEGS